MARKNKFSAALVDAETKLAKARTDLATYQRKATELTQRIPKLEAAVASLRALSGEPTKPTAPTIPEKGLPPGVHKAGETCPHGVIKGEGNFCSMCERKPLTVAGKGVIRGGQVTALGDDKEWEGTGVKQ